MLRFLLAAIAVVFVAAVHAQGAYPGKPIAMVVGFAPGGGTDTVARILAKGIKVQ